MSVRKWTPVLGAAALLVSASASAWAGPPPVQQREDNQQTRIEQGERSGQLTPEEADRLHQQQDRIAQTEADMRARNGGRLTGADRERLQRRLNRASADIKELKHNDAHGPGTGGGGG